MGVSFRKPTRPSLPLRKAPPLISTLFNGLYTPFGSPSSGGQKPSGTRGCNRPTVLTFLPLRLSCKESSTSNQAFLLRRKDVTALRCSEPLRSKVGGPSKVFAMVLRDGTAWREESFDFKVYSLQFMAYSLYSGNFVDLL